jgi:hypothetical protein
LPLVTSYTQTAHSRVTVKNEPTRWGYPVSDFISIYVGRSVFPRFMVHKFHLELHFVSLPITFSIWNFITDYILFGMILRGEETVSKQVEWVHQHEVCWQSNGRSQM